MFYDKTSLLNRYSSMEARSFGDPKPEKIDKKIELLQDPVWVEKTAREAAERGEPATPWSASLGAGMDHEENMSWAEAAAEVVLCLRPDAERRALLARELNERMAKIDSAASR